MSSIPVLPIVVLPLEQARLASLVITDALIATLGIVRGRLGELNAYRSAVDTLVIAGVTALAQVVIGSLVS